jgi:two-component system, NtrC family, sensor kinase
MLLRRRPWPLSALVTRKTAKEPMTPHASTDTPFREFVEAIAVPCAVCDGERMLAGNQALSRLTLHSMEALLAMPFGALLRAEDREAVARAGMMCLKDKGSPPTLFATLLTAQGGERPVEIHARPAMMGGKPVVVLTCVDQSDVQHVQTSLIGMTEMMRQIIDSAPIASFVIDQNYTVTHWNSACENMTGLKRHQLLGSQSAWRAFYATERPVLAHLIVDGVEEAEMKALYADMLRPSSAVPGGYEAEAFFPQYGQEGAWLFITAAPLRNADGDVIGAIETLQDVTERRRSEAALHDHRAELERLVTLRTNELAATARELERFVAAAPYGVAYTAEGKIQRVNAAMASLFGYTQAEMLGMPGRDLYMSDKEYADLGGLARTQFSNGEPLQLEMRMRHADGRAIWSQIDAHVANVEDSQRGTWWMIQDRTEIRDAQEELETHLDELKALNSKLEEAQNQLLQQDKMASIGQLAAGVAHEINNPVGFVSSNLKTLRQYAGGLLDLSKAYEAARLAPGDAGITRALDVQRKVVELDYLAEDLPQLLDECDDGLDRVKRIVLDLKGFSRVDHADWQEMDINAGMQSTLNVVRHEVKNKATIDMQLATLPLVTCLAGQLNQVFMNLIVNAAHAIGERGTITIASGVQDQWAWMQVADSGCGMTEEVQRRIFEPFYTTKNVGKGTGLGLSLSFSIVQKHGGNIQVHSAPGQGSAFRVWVPVGGPTSLVAGELAPDWDGSPETVA